MKKGAVFTIDIVLAVFVVFVAISFTLFFIARAGEVSRADHQLVNIGADVTRILIERGTLQELDHDAIEAGLYTIIPANYDMLLRIQGNFSYANGTIEVGGEVPERRYIVAGEQALYVEDRIAKVTYFVWPRT